MEKTSLGLDADLACILCYAAGPFSGLLMLWLEKKDNLVRFHALQATLAFLPAAILLPIFFFLKISDQPAPRFIFYTTCGVFCLFTVLMLVWIVPAAWRMERRHFPIVGKIVDKYIPNDGTEDAFKIHGE